MGNQESQTPNPNHPLISRCPICLDIATYRIRYEPQEDDLQDEHQTKRAPKGFPQLMKYQSGQYWLPMRCVNYTSCENCMTAVVKPYFAHYQDGWYDKKKPLTIYELTQFH